MQTKPLSEVSRGTLVRIYADLLHLGLPIDQEQTLLLKGVAFLAAEKEHPPSVLGSLERISGNKKKDGVVVRHGKLAVLINNAWHIGWAMCGYHPQRKEWYYIQERKFMRVSKSMWLFGMGTNVFVHLGDKA